MDLDEGTRLFIAMPFGSIKLRSTSVSVDKPGTWGALLLTGGSFLQGRSLETAASPYAPHKALYEGPPKSRLKSEAGTTMRSGVICLELIK